MDLQDKQKEFTMASGGRMFLLLGGIMLVFTALTNTGQYGVQMFRIAAEAAKGTDEYVEVMETLGMGVMALRVMGAAFLVTALVEVTAGIWCIRSCNRVDRSRITLRVVLALLAVEIIMQIYLLITKMSGLGMLFSALLMPLILLWGVTRFRKLAKLDPERVYAFKKDAAPSQSRQAPTKSKSLRERAMMTTAVGQDASGQETVETGAKDADIAEFGKHDAEAESIDEDESEPDKDKAESGTEDKDGTETETEDTDAENSEEI